MSSERFEPNADECEPVVDAERASEDVVGRPHGESMDSVGAAVRLLERNGYGVVKKIDLEGSERRKLEDRKIAYEQMAIDVDDLQKEIETVVREREETERLSVDQLNSTRRPSEEKQSSVDQDKTINALRDERLRTENSTKDLETELQDAKSLVARLTDELDETKRRFVRLSVDYEELYDASKDQNRYCVDIEKTTISQSLVIDGLCDKIIELDPTNRDYGLPKTIEEVSMGDLESISFGQENVSKTAIDEVM